MTIKGNSSVIVILRDWEVRISPLLEYQSVLGWRYELKRPLREPLIGDGLV